MTKFLRIALYPALAGLSLMMTLTASPMNDELLPARIGPWSLLSDTVYTPENLFDYIDGGAELYLSYGFRKVVSKSYSADNQPDIIVDVFDMNTSKDAYGVFMYSAENATDLIGQGTQVNEGSLLFWVDNYFVSIMAYPETRESRETILNIARTLEKGIGRRGDLPGILEYLPESGLDRTSIRYFHHHAWQNSHYYFSSENILLIDKETDAVTARYGKTDNQKVLLLLEYPTGERTSQAYNSFVSNYLPDLQGKAFLQVEDGSFTGVDRKENLLIIVFRAASGAEVEEITSETKNRININQP